MNRAQRNAHARTWPLVALALLAAIAAAVAVQQHRASSARAAAPEWTAR